VCASTIVARADGSLEDGALAALAICGLLLVVAFYIHELLRVRRFFRQHSTALWRRSERIYHASDVRIRLHSIRRKRCCTTLHPPSLLQY
jgi:hypothetical protein